jgi:hypothetical protein
MIRLQAACAAAQYRYQRWRKRPCRSDVSRRVARHAFKGRAEIRGNLSIRINHGQTMFTHINVIDRDR